jgi:hypothetical protein
MLHRLRQSRTLHTLTAGPKFGVHFTGNHYRFHSKDVTVITDKGKTIVVTAFKGPAGGWAPEQEGL